MNRTRTEAGLSLVEVLIALVVMSGAMTILAGLMVENTRVSNDSHVRLEIQSNVRTSLALISQKLRTAGWDPTDSDLPVVTLDSDSTDGIETLDVFADLNGDGDLADAGESVTIRHIQNRIEWRRGVGLAFETVAVRITNDADGDGTQEPMFVPDASPDPGRIRLQITAEGPGARPGDEPLRYTASTDVILRNAG